MLLNFSALYPTLYGLLVDVKRAFVKELDSKIESQNIFLGSCVLLVIFFNYILMYSNEIMIGGFLGAELSSLSLH